MKGNPAVPGGSLKSKPTWLNTFGVFVRVGFFFGCGDTGLSRRPGTHLMEKPGSTTAQQIAQAARDFEQQATGRPPSSVTVVLSENTLIITLHGTLSPAEMAVVKSEEGAAKLREFHRLLFATASGSLRREIRWILGVEVAEATAEVATSTGTMVQVFSLAQAVPADTWSGTDPGPAQPARESHGGTIPATG